MLFKKFLAVSFKNYKAVVLTCICEKRIVNNFNLVSFYSYPDVLIVKLNILHLGIRFTIRINDTISAKAIICRSLSMVSTIGLIIFTKTVFGPNCLIYEIPDKSALITRLSVSKICILEHSANAVSHGM